MAISPARDSVLVGGRDGKGLRNNRVALKLLRIELDMSIKVVSKNLTPGKTGDKGAFEIKWNPSKLSVSLTHRTI